jgi:hypothetical protein
MQGSKMVNWQPQVLSSLQQGPWMGATAHCLQLAATHMGGGPASFTGATHLPSDEQAPWLVQSRHATPPTPHVATDCPPAQPLAVQQPSQVPGSQT